MSKEIVTKPTTKVTLKQKVGYIDKEASVTQTKFAEMEITQENEKGNEGNLGVNDLD